MDKKQRKNLKEEIKKLRQLKYLSASQERELLTKEQQLDENSPQSIFSGLLSNNILDTFEANNREAFYDEILDDKIKTTRDKLAQRMVVLAKQQLTAVQWRRLEKVFLGDKTQIEVAVAEGVSQPAVSYSVFGQKMSDGSISSGALNALKKICSSDEKCQEMLFEIGELEAKLDEQTIA